MRDALLRVVPLGFVLTIAVFASCVDERIVFRDRELLDGVNLAATGNFVGYSDTTATRKVTVCGNCHVTRQAEWKETAHAKAFASISTGATTQAVCEGCHTVNSRGNVVPGTTGGWLSVKDSRFKDVQCEACHGPGGDHVQNPTRANRPLAPIHVDTALTRGCGECHSGAHHPFVQEWRSSRHGRVQTSAVGRPECVGCHVGQSILVQFNVNTNYIEHDSIARLPLAITCGVCHDPHTARNGAQLRFPINNPDQEQNLCMKCHHKRGQPDPTTTRGPHSPEGPLLMGDAGWWPPNLPIEPGQKIAGTHGTERNPRLCAGCHVQSYEVTDSITKAFKFRTTGHSFAAIPCLAPNGAPLPGSTQCERSARSFASCTASGCHGDQNAARSAMTVAELRIRTLNTELKRLLALVPASAFSGTDNVYTTAEGSRFNSQLADVDGSVVHNPFLVEALLTGSIAQLKKDYNVTSAPGIDLRNVLGSHVPPTGKSGRVAVRASSAAGRK